MNFRFTILASGSTGNATVVELGDTSILIDAGLSMKKITQLMEARGIDPRKLSAVVVTHEHADHIKGLGPFARKYGLPLYANEKTWVELERLIGEIAESQKQVAATGSTLEFGDLRAESFAVSHDAAEPVGYCFYGEGAKLSIATDLGYVSPNVKEKIIDSDVLVLETNHDIEMLRIGRYPWNIKRRILGDLGHLSNEAAGEALCELATERTRRVYIAHLSQDHNMLDLAKMTLKERFAEPGTQEHLVRLKLMDTYADRATDWDDITRA